MNSGFWDRGPGPGGDHLHHRAGRRRHSFRTPCLVCYCCRLRRKRIYRIRACRVNTLNSSSYSVRRPWRIGAGAESSASWLRSNAPSAGCIAIRPGCNAPRGGAMGKEPDAMLPRAETIEIGLDPLLRALEQCIGRLEHCIARPEHCIVPLEQCISRLEQWIARLEHCNWRLEQCSERLEVAAIVFFCRARSRAASGTGHA